MGRFAPSPAGRDLAWLGMGSETRFSVLPFRPFWSLKLRSYDMPEIFSPGPRPPAGSASLLAAFLVGFASAPLSGQHQASPPPSAYALEGVTVVHGDGGREEGVTLVVRSGMVERLGPDAEVPEDARVLEGDDLHVYPGIVDPYGRASMELPSPETEGVPAWDPPREVQGLTPSVRVADHLTATGASLEDERIRGVVASAVFPPRGPLPGTGAFLLHRKDAEAPRDLVLDPAVGVGAAFEGSRVGYPGTLFGVMALLRQAFADAEHRQILRAEYDADPSGIDRPGRDQDFEVIRQLAAGEYPVFFRANEAQAVRRVLALSEELGFTPVVVGGGEAWRVADELRARNVPVVVSADLPGPEEWDPEDDGELDPAAHRERERLENLYANAGRLRDAGVTVAFTGHLGSADAREGARKAVEYGMSEADALRALTSVPAELLGAPELGRVQEGGSATFVVANGPLLDEDTAILHTFVAGRPTAGADPGMDGNAEAQGSSSGGGR